MSKPISHEDLCRLSRLFNSRAFLDRPQDYRINEWLKEQIAAPDALGERAPEEMPRRPTSSAALLEVIEGTSPGLSAPLAGMETSEAERKALAAQAEKDNLSDAAGSLVSPSLLCAVMADLDHLIATLVEAKAELEIALEGDDEGTMEKVQQAFAAGKEDGLAEAKAKAARARADERETIFRAIEAVAPREIAANIIASIRFRTEKGPP